jgi:hypothetical protein
MKFADVTIINGGGDIYAVFANHRRAREIVSHLVPDAQFTADTIGILPPDCTVAAVRLCWRTVSRVSVRTCATQV